MIEPDPTFLGHTDPQPWVKLMKIYSSSPIEHSRLLRKDMKIKRKYTTNLIFWMKANL